MTADVYISAQSLIQGGESDGERVDTFPAPEAQQRVRERHLLCMKHTKIIHSMNESKVCGA